MGNTIWESSWYLISVYSCNRYIHLNLPAEGLTTFQGSSHTQGGPARPRGLSSFLPPASPPVPPSPSLARASRSLPPHPPTSTTPEMALLRRQYYGTYEYFDDQNPTVWNLFVGSWTRYADPTFDNYTLTATSTPGASLSFAFIGTQIVYAWSCFEVLTS